jgi:hypothetical protein
MARAKKMSTEEFDRRIDAGEASANLAREGTLRLLARGVDGDLGAAARRGASPGPLDGSDLPAPSSSAEEPIAAIGLEPRNAH